MEGGSGARVRRPVLTSFSSCPCCAGSSSCTGSVSSLSYRRPVFWSSCGRASLSRVVVAYIVRCGRVALCGVVVDVDVVWCGRRVVVWWCGGGVHEVNDDDER